MRKFKLKGYGFLRDIITYLRLGWKSRLFSYYLKSCCEILLFNLNRFRQALDYVKRNRIQSINAEKVQRLKKISAGLHLLLPTDPLFTYSILIPVKHSHPSYFRKSLQSALDQTAPSLEILIGFERKQSALIYQILEELKQSFPNKIREFHFHSLTDLPQNELAKRANGNFLFILEENDWIRPDLLFRYEQTLRALPHPQWTVLYCHENKITEKDEVIPMTEIHKPLLHFPFFFGNFSERGLMVPKCLWNKIGGLRSAYQEAKGEDLILRLETAGAVFQLIPVCLYSQRMIPGKTHQIEEKSQEMLMRSLTDYTKAKGLDWTWSLGYDHTIRAIPSIQQHNTIQVIVPFKDQKALTLSCIQHVLKQKEVNIKLTAVDNASTDVSISQEICSLGAEVLTINEPFNYSRLNNLAVNCTKTASNCEILLFLNNDVDLEEGALIEMLRWIDQPQIGMVGCRLHYPDGRLQHGGVYLDYTQYHDRLPYNMQWNHAEKIHSFPSMKLTKKLGIVPAVTAACALIKRQIFLEMGGFDEIWYPIAYSDTNLAIRLSLIGLKCFYTPYAVGTHHESISRKEVIEDYENSLWLHQLLLRNRHQFPFFSKEF